MTQTGLSELTTRDLVEEFARLALAQDAANLRGEIASYNRLFSQMMGVVNELKGRSGDQRTALKSLYSHSNMQVRMQAAKLTLAVAPDEARAQLQSIVASHWFPQAGDAGMCLLNLERGVFKPQ